MSSRFLTILLVSFAVIAIGVVWLSSRDGRTVSLEESSPEVAVSGDDLGPISQTRDLAREESSSSGSPKAVEPVASPPSRESASSAPDLELRDAWWVEGRVVLPPGTPPDEHVEVIALGRKSDSRPPHRAAIGPDGSFRVAFARGTGRGWLMLDAKYLFLPIEVTLSPSADKTGTELHPVLGGCIRGRVVVPPEADELKRRLVGLQVDVTESGDPPSPLGWITAREAQVDANLAFEARGVPAGVRKVEIRMPGAVSKTPTKVQIEPGRVYDVVVELVPSARVAGIVVDPAGDPIGAGATVIASSEGHPDAGSTTNGEGQFLVQDIAPGAVTLSARAEGWIEIEPTQFVLQLGQAIDEVRIVLHRGARISGTVLAPDGSGWTEALVFLRREDGPLRSSYGNVRPALGSETDGKGRFEFTDLVPGTYRLQATDARSRQVPVDFEGSTRTGIVIAEGESIDDVELHLPSFGRVTGRVIGLDGVGVVDAVVFAQGKDWSLGYFRAIPRTDGEGRFAIEGLPLGEVWIAALKQPYVASAPAHAIVRAGEAAEVEIELVRGTRLRFTMATSSDAREPFEYVARDDRGGEWMLYPGWMESSENSSSPESGGGSYGPLPPGRYEIVATSRDGQTWSGPAEVRGEAEVKVALELDL